ncbi:MULTISPECIES: RebB family R body protein [Methylomonas]|uniref:RebB family R body protein n=1 Tax=Methylomonas TaxID=416 RepID=UPI0016811493|nr:RebB family R body protein [Methylomonas rhizoryzae]
MTITTFHQDRDAGVAGDFQHALEGKVLQGLGLAIENAVTAQSQLYLVGQAAFTQAIQMRLSRPVTSSPAEVCDTAAATSTDELAAQLQTIANAGLGALDNSLAAGDSAESATRLMTAFSAALAMLNEVNTQQMLGYVLVVLAAGIDIDSTLGPAQARTMETLLSNNRLIQFISELKAAEGDENRQGA